MLDDKRARQPAENLLGNQPASETDMRHAEFRGHGPHQLVPVTDRQAPFQGNLAQGVGGGGHG